ncbi:MAG TPA: hypothetical protein VMD09_02025 [Solirubrobacteraceae bacterium]|nr:hypothetical protein [Solirubrobacteraceae bacterium]
MSRKGRAIGYGSALLLVLVGVGVGISFGGTVGQVAALVLVGLGLVQAVALVFYEVGLSEDRERAQEEAKKRKAAEPRRSQVRAHLERRRGQRRRLP